MEDGSKIIAKKQFFSDVLSEQCSKCHFIKKSICINELQKESGDSNSSWQRGRGASQVKFVLDADNAKYCKATYYRSLP